MVANHTIITGPKRRPTRSVPCRWMANTPTSVTTVSGTTYGVNTEVTTLSPSIALSTVMAGVIMPSP